MKHTPGPWKLNYIDNIVIHIETDDEYWIATAGGGRYDIETDANAKLIAAAPDLLDACKSVLRSINDLKPDPTLSGCAFALENAIKKAEGE